MEGAGQARQRRGRDVRRLSRTVEREREWAQAWGVGEDWERNSGGVRQVTHQLPHLLQSVGLHQDVVLGKQQSSNFTQFADRGRVGIGNDGS